MKCQTLNHNLQKKLRGDVEIPTMISYIFESHVKTKQVLWSAKVWITISCIFQIHIRTKQVLFYILNC